MDFVASDALTTTGITNGLDALVLHLAEPKHHGVAGIKTGMGKAADFHENADLGKGS